MSGKYEIIKEALEKTKSCAFKDAWIPKGWACVKISIFAKELTRKLEEWNAKGI